MFDPNTAEYSGARFGHFGTAKRQVLLKLKIRVVFSSSLHELRKAAAHTGKLFKLHNSSRKLHQTALVTWTKF